ncbi:hypothetical protein [Sphingomonas sp.]|uniref:hypothetical protein n=1 Tax=Sphingomonas sp. TaxID=28214 RepID=UPI002FCC2964
MREERDAMMLVRAELGERLAGLERLWAGTSTRATARASARDIAASISAIRNLAATYGLLPTVRLAEALERAVAQDGNRRRASCPTALYLDRLHDAIDCSRSDDQASEAIIASVSVRLDA